MTLFHSTRPHEKTSHLQYKKHDFYATTLVDPKSKFIALKIARFHIKTFFLNIKIAISKNIIQPFKDRSIASYYSKLTKDQKEQTQNSEKEQTQNSDSGYSTQTIDPT